METLQQRVAKHFQQIREVLNQIGAPNPTIEFEDFGLIGGMLTVTTNLVQLDEATVRFPDKVTVIFGTDYTDEDILAEIKHLISKLTEPINQKLVSRLSGASAASGIDNAIINETDVSIFDLLAKVQLAGIPESEFLQLLVKAQTDPEALANMESFLNQDVEDMLAFWTESVAVTRGKMVKKRRINQQKRRKRKKKRRK